MEKLIEVKNLAYHYDTNSPYLFKDLSFSLNKGEVIFLTGKSGIGKSTLLKLLTKTLIPTSGNIEYYSIIKSSSFYSDFVFQDPRLLPWRTVYDNIQLPLECTNLSKAEKKLLSH
jgi:ABC-type nitrate/sulfonate/bicarbonate transport system ATPase subunit